MIVFRSLVVVASAEVRVPQPGGPIRPPFPLAISDGAKFGVILDLRIFFNELPEGLKALRAGVGEQLTRKRFENASLVLHDTAVVDQLRFVRTLARPGGCKFGNALNVDIKLIPEKSRRRRVRTWLKRFV